MSQQPIVAGKAAAQQPEALQPEPKTEPDDPVEADHDRHKVSSDDSWELVSKADPEDAVDPDGKKKTECQEPVDPDGKEKTEC